VGDRIEHSGRQGEAAFPLKIEDRWLFLIIQESIPDSRWQEALARYVLLLHFFYFNTTGPAETMAATKRERNSFSGQEKAASPFCAFGVPLKPCALGFVILRTF
jgi:hypothetical protein